MKTTHSFHQVVTLPGRVAGQSARGLRRLLFTATLALVLGLGANARASDPVGIYAFVDKVVFEPNETSPERIQVWGGFALAVGNGFYAPAQRGYMYFQLNPKEEKICRNEWNDLKSVAGTAQIVGFARRRAPTGTIRDPDAKPNDPDLYPIGFGLTKVSSRLGKGNYQPLAELRKMQKGSSSDRKK